MPSCFLADFESPYTVAALSGQQGWTATADYSVVVDGDQVLELGAVAGAVAATRSLSPGPLQQPAHYRLTFDVKAVAVGADCDVRIVDPADVLLFRVRLVSTASDLEIYPDGVLAYTIASAVGAYSTLRLDWDFVTGVGTLYVDGVDVASWTQTTSYTTLESLQAAKLRIVTAGATTGAIRFNNIDGLFGPQSADLLDRDCNEPFWVVELDIDDPDGAVTRTYSDVTRTVVSLHTTAVDEDCDGRLARLGVLSDTIHRLTGAIELSIMDLMLAAVARFEEGVQSISDAAYDPTADALPDRSYLRAARVWLAFNDQDRDDWLSVFNGLIEQPGQLTDGRLSINLTDAAQPPLADLLDVGTITAAQFPNAPPGSLGKPGPIIGGLLAKVGFGRVPLIPLEQADGTVPADTDYLVAAHPLTAIGGTLVGVNAVFLERDAAIIPLTPITHYTAAVVPSPGDPLDDYTVVTILATIAPEARDTYYASVYGMDTVGDGSGTLIDNPSELLETILLRYGGFTAADLDTISLAATEALCTSRNYVAAGWVGDKKTVSAFLREFCESFQFRPSMRIGSDNLRRLGWSLFTIDFDLIDTARSYDTQQNAGRLTARSATEELLTRVVGLRQKDWGRDSYDVTDGFDSAAPATSEQVEFTVTQDWVQDETTAQDVLNRVLFEYGSPRAFVTFDTSLRGVNDPPTAIIEVSHREAIGGGVYADEPFEIVRREIDPETSIVRLTARDLRGLWGRTGELANDDPTGAINEGVPSVVRVPRGTVTVTVAAASNTIAFSSPVTIKAGDLVLIEGALAGNLLRGILIDTGLTASLGDDLTGTAFKMLDAWDGVAQNAGTNEAGIASTIYMTYSTATPEIQFRQWFLSPFANGDPPKLLF